MGKPKFEYFVDQAKEWRYNLFAGNGENILRSVRGYACKRNVKRAIASIKRISQLDGLYIRKSRRRGLFSRYYWFVLESVKKRDLGISEMYESSQGMETGINSVKLNAPEAEVKFVETD